MKWHGLDLCPIVITDSQCKHPLYHPILMLAHVWELDIPPHDVFVCSHTFEHMDMDQVSFVSNLISLLQNFLDISDQAAGK